MKTILVSRYHPLLVLLHWLLAVLIVAMLCIGFMVLEPMPNVDPGADGNPRYHPYADVETGAGDDRQTAVGPARAGHPLRLLCSGAADGRVRLCDGDLRRAQQKRVPAFGRPAAR